MRLAAVALIALATPVAAQRRPQQELPKPPNIDTTIYSRLKFRYVGPVGNRIIAIAGVAGSLAGREWAQHRGATAAPAASH